MRKSEVGSWESEVAATFRSPYFGGLKASATAIITLLIFFSTSALASSAISSTELIEHSKRYDGKIVVYRGEVIGDIMIRGNFALVNLHDGENALGVWAEASQVEEIEFVGGYKAKGDLLEVKGVFNRACSEHGGDMDIHAQVVRVIQKGYKKNHPINRIKLVAALLLAVLSMGLFGLERYLKKPSRRAKLK